MSGAREGHTVKLEQASWGQRVKGCICYPGTVSYLPEGDADSLKIFEQGNDMTAFVVWEGNSSNHAE